MNNLIKNLLSEPEDVKEARRQKHLDDLKKQDAEWEEWRKTPEGTAGILKDHKLGLAPSQRTSSKLKELLSSLKSKPI